MGGEASSSRRRPSRCSSRTGSVTEHGLPISIRISGAGTPRASRWGTRAGTRGARRRSSARSSRGNGRTGWYRTSSSPRVTAATSPGPTSGRPSGHPRRPRASGRPGSRSRRSTPPRRCGSSVARPIATAQSRSSESWRRSSTRGTRTSTASERRTAAAWPRSGIRGSPGWTTRRSGTRPSRGSS